MGYMPHQEDKTLKFGPINLSQLEEILKKTVSETQTPRHLELNVQLSKYYDCKSVKVMSIFVTGAICQCEGGRKVALLKTSSRHNEKEGNIFINLNFMFPFKYRKWDYDLYDEEIEDICKKFNKNYKIVAE